MHSREVYKKRPKVIPFKGMRKVHGKMKWKRICHGIRTSREKKHCTRSEVVEVEPQYNQKGSGHL